MPVNLIIRNPLDWDALAIARNANGANRRELSDYVRFLKAQAVWTNLGFFRDFANAKSLNHSFGPNISFTRLSNATYFDAAGVLQLASQNQPRFDHDPVTGESLGLLIEEQRTNILPNSQAGGSVNGVIGGGTCTISIASPAVVSLTAHGLPAGTPVVFTTTGALPTGLTAGTTYYVISTGLAANSFRVSATVGGAAVNTSGSQSGTHVVTAPGFPPPYWFVGPSPGITRQIVSSGTQNGMSYVDVRYHGTETTGSVSFPSIGFDFGPTATAAQGERWSLSCFVAIAGGTTSGVTFQTDIYESDANLNFLASGGGNFTPSASLSKFTTTRQLSNASVARAQGRVVVVIAANATIDVTLRIAAPQLELGAFPTSYIPTTTTGLTRSAEAAVVEPIASFYNAAEGTLFVEASSNDSTAGRFVRSAEIGTDSSNYITLSREVDLAAGRTSIFNAGAGQFDSTLGTWVLGATAKLIVAFKSNDFAAKISGASAITDSAGTLPSVSKLQLGATTIPGAFPGAYLNGRIRKIAYWPTRLSNALLQILTT